MKSKYFTPLIEVEELNKVDVLCSSAGSSEENPDNGQQSLLDFESWWD